MRIRIVDNVLSPRCTCAGPQQHDDCTCSSRRRTLACRIVNNLDSSPYDRVPNNLVDSGFRAEEVLMIYRAHERQLSYGRPIGILTLEEHIPCPPGTPGNPTTFAHPV